MKEDVMNLDPVAEMENVQTELILSDIEVCLKKKNKVTTTIVTRLRKT